MHPSTPNLAEITAANQAQCDAMLASINRIGRRDERLKQYDNVRERLWIESVPSAFHPGAMSVRQVLVGDEALKAERLAVTHYGPLEWQMDWIMFVEDNWIMEGQQSNALAEFAAMVECAVSVNFFRSKA